jgi:hypothetical protein
MEEDEQRALLAGKVAWLEETVGIGPCGPIFEGLDCAFNEHLLWIHFRIDFLVCGSTGTDQKDERQRQSMKRNHFDLS